MFTNDVERAAVCQKLCDSVRLGEMFAADGPTKRALAFRKSAPFSSGEKLMLRLAWLLWNDSNPSVGVIELVNTLDGPRLRLVGSLLVALASYGSTAIAEWLAAADRQEGID